MKSIGEQIKEIRHIHEITQQEFAEKINVTRSAVTNWENNRNYPDIQTIVLISDLFDISLDQLLKGDTMVIKKITNDTKVRKKQSKQLKVFYFLSGVVICLFLAFAVPAFYNSDMFSENQIESVEIQNNELVVKTNLPFYREYTGYVISDSNDPWKAEMKIMTTISFSKNKNSVIRIPLKDNETVLKNKIGIDFTNFYGKNFHTVRIDNLDIFQ
ncbi:helix-turn-helix domain-containing protein [Enterococcus casseliflavus]|uniref:helix-turn-helix domain-containing protein n=1 Tax=Enterococcus TaxID=1350 RepID=UPI0018ABE161|nr:helix-turn-helix transcriptional regulator [Enterococcus casseliflavus]